jgi:MFS family permease
MLLGVAVALIGLAAGAEFDLIAYLCSRYFGLKNYSQIYAWQFVAFSIASGAAPMIFGRVFDSAGSYNPALIAAALLFVAGGALLLALGRYPDFSKQP